VPDQLTSIAIPAFDSIDLDDVLAMYHALWPVSSVGPQTSRNAARLTDLLDSFDGFILDGYGVINIGNGVIDGFADFLAAARACDKPIVVLTNGASFPSAATARKYQGWHLAITRSQVLSSRDVLAAQLAPDVAKNGGVPPRYGCFGATIDPLFADQALIYGRDARFWDEADAFLFLGALDWHDADQAAFEMAMLERPRPVHVANPDVAAPQDAGRFSAEPGYWTARMMQRLAKAGHAAPVQWYGKPDPRAFEQAVARLVDIAGRPLDRTRLAMVGDSLHTDILGGAMAGLQTVLLTGYGLFRGGAYAACQDRFTIRPHWVVDRL
jgi:glycerol 3-phosphatase-2